jgi:hypothetical protein
VFESAVLDDPVDAPQLDGHPELVQAVQVLEPRPVREQPAVLAGDEFLRQQPGQRLPYRGAGDAVQLGETLLAQPVERAEPSADQVVAERPVRLLAQV